MDIEQCKQAEMVPLVQYILRSIRFIVVGDQAEMNDSDGSNRSDKESYELLFIMSGTEQGKCYLQGPGRYLTIDQKISNCSYYQVRFETRGYDAASGLLPDKQDTIRKDNGTP